MKRVIFLLLLTAAVVGVQAQDINKVKDRIYD